MQKPNIITLPTSQMQAFCDVLGLDKEIQDSLESMVNALEEADFSNIEVVKPEKGVPRPANAVGFEPAEVEPEIVERRKAVLGR